MLNAIKNVLAGLANLVAGILFIVVAHVAWGAAALIAGGSVVGAQIGARYGRRLPQEILRRIVIVYGVIVAGILSSPSEHLQLGRADGVVRGRCRRAQSVTLQRVVVLVALVRRRARALVGQHAQAHEARARLRDVERAQEQLRRPRARHARTGTRPAGS